MGETLEKVLERARQDAAVYVSEAGSALDPDGTNWDGDAWDVAWRELGLDEEKAKHFWSVYQHALVGETVKLCHPGGAG